MPWALLEEAQRQLAICNACRYCEGYCAVFPALERRAIVLEGDLAYLANLCHDCRACLAACMYAPPHEFAVDVPALLSRARADTYEHQAWPRWLGAAFARGPLALVATTLAGVAVVLAVAIVAGGGPAGLLAARTGPGSFYALVPYLAMAVPALLLTAYAVLVLGLGAVRLWRAAGGVPEELRDRRLWLTALDEGLALRWMRGGGQGCPYPDEDRPSGARRRLHILLVAGFASAFAATLVATAGQDVLGLQPPFPLWSPPVVLGAGGGLAMIVGATGLLWLKLRARPADTRAQGLDHAFLGAILAVSVTGMLLLVLRDTRAMGPLLVAHLATLAGLYLTAPYGKLAHATYRLAALLRNAAEVSAD
jgi:citrate/tricarballylate utilization protein